MLKEYDVQTTIPAQDLERARSFYAEKLGLEVAEEVSGGIFFKSGKSHIFVFKSTGKASGDHTQMGWSVRDIEQEVENLRRRRVEFEEYDLPDFKTENGIVTAGEERSAWFRDSEGNLLAIRQQVRVKPSARANGSKRR